MKQIKETAEQLGREYGAKKLYLFGSYARGEATEKSDVDIRIDEGNIHGLFALSGFRNALIERLGRKVDLLTTDSLDQDFLDEIKADEVLLYAA